MRTFGFIVAVALIIALGCMPGMDRRGVDHTKHWRERMERRMLTTPLAPDTARLEFAAASPEARGHFADYDGAFTQRRADGSPPELRLSIDPASATAGEVGGPTAAKPPGGSRLAFRSDKITPTDEPGVLLVSGTWSGVKEWKTSFTARLEGEAGNRTLKATMPLRLGDVGVSPATAGWDALTLTLTAKVRD